MRGWLCFFALVGVACRESPRGAEPPYEEVWIHDTYLLREANGQTAGFVAGFRRVRLFVDGRVTDHDETLGYVDLRAPPQSGRGVVLYAARTTPLRDLNDPRVVWGHLQAAALVSVRPLAEGYEVAPGPPFGRRSFVVSRDDLTVSPASEVPSSARGRHCGSVRFRPKGSDETSWTDPCLPLQGGDDPGTVRQRLLGVELEGIRIDAHCPEPPAERCWAATVVEKYGQLTWLPAPGAVSRVVEMLPVGHLPLEKGTRLRRHLEGADEVFVMTRGGRCRRKPWRDPAPDRLSPETRITTSRTSIVADTARVGHFERGRHFVEVGGGLNHVDLHPLMLPAHAVSYAEEDVERWFFNRAACEASQEQAFRRYWRSER